MTIIDRYMLRQFVQNYVIWFVSLAGVYVVIDAATKSISLSNSARGAAVLKPMVVYYGFHMLTVFDFINSAVVLLAAMFTMAWIQRHNEMTALMAAGISRLRVAMPVLAVAITVTLLSAVNREIVIPGFKEQLTLELSDRVQPQNAVKEMKPVPLYDDDTGVHISGEKLVIDPKKNEKMIVQPEFIASGDNALCQYGMYWKAAVAYYQPAQGGRPAGYKLIDVSDPKVLAQRPSLMLNGRPVLMTPRDNPAWLKPNEAFVVSNVSPDELTGELMMWQLDSTRELIRAMKYHSSVCFGPKPRVLVHSRIVQPLLDITLLFLGLPLVIAMDNRNVFRAIGLCILLVVLFLGVPMLCQYFCTDLPIISPSLAAWTPLMIFVPAAVGMSSWMWER